MDDIKPVSDLGIYYILKHILFWNINLLIVFIIVILGFVTALCLFTLSNRTDYLYDFASNWFIQAAKQ